MTITLPAEQDSFIGHLVSMGRFASPEAAVVKAVQLLETEEAGHYLPVEAFSREEAERVYAPDVHWEEIENSLAGLVSPEV